MKRFFNQKETVVTETLDGVIAASGDRLARLDGYPHTKVVVRREIDPSKVAIISGGGAGHEPAHAGFVGRGLLTAAVSGEVFASPSVDAVLDGIVAVTGEAGALLIVKNYTGDRLNFGLAAEKAKKMGLDVEMVIVGDDIALPNANQPRGVAGTLFVHKLAGYMAEQGASLLEIAAAARTIAAETVSLGVALSSCTVPFQPEKLHLGPNEAELGLGIHGEPGVERIGLLDVKSLVALMAERLMNSLPSPESRYGLLVNNLGSVPPMEMSIIAREVLHSRMGQVVDLLFGPAPLMTSLDMNGFSLSLVLLTKERQRALLSPVEPSDWRAGVEVAPITIFPKINLSGESEYEASSAPAVRKIIDAVCQTLIEEQAQLDEYDAKAGDGDTGSTFAAGARAIQSELENFPLAEHGPLCIVLANTLMRSMGGSSGVLLSILLTATGTKLESGETWPDALAAGVAAMQQYGGAKQGDRTMLDALIPAVELLQQNGTLDEAFEVANQGVEKTRQLGRAGAGRSSYLGEASLIGVPDPGSVAIATIFRVVRQNLV